MPNVSVVRSEPLSARMDPEDLRELITTYQAYALKPVGALCELCGRLGDEIDQAAW